MWRIVSSKMPFKINNSFVSINFIRTIDQHSTSQRKVKDYLLKKRESIKREINNMEDLC